MERTSESTYYVAQRLEQILECYQRYPDSPNIRESLVERIGKAVDLLRWYDWEEEQRRRQSLKGS